MTRMLAIATDAEEAETAVQHGAEIIDVKDVDGPFGTAAPALVRATVRCRGTAPMRQSGRRRAQVQPEALARTLRRLSSTLARATSNSVCMHTRRRRIACAR
jgi:hypothetical protein